MMGLHRRYGGKQRLFLAIGLWLIVFMGGLMLTPVSGIAGEALPANIADEISQKLAALNINDVAIDLNTRISIPDNTAAGIKGVDLFATVLRHTSLVAGETTAARPTIVVATPYRRELMMILYLPLLLHDYNLLAVDVRGSGSSGGSWVSFGPEEHCDAAYVVDHFIPGQPWSDGRVGMIGPSYMGISQMLAAGQIETDAYGNPTHLKALFPLVTMADCYRDIVMHGGNIDLEFIPAWLGGVDILGVLPPLLLGGEDTAFQPDLGDIEEAFQIWDAHLRNIPVTLGWIMDGDNLVKNDFYDTKSPMIYWPQKPAGGWQFGPEYPADLGSTVIPKSLPVFLTGGWFDLFTRGTLNTYKYGLANHDVSDKAMMIGPWYHLDGAIGMGVAGLSFCDIPARWFDWKIKGDDDPFMVNYPVLLYVMGADRWRAEKDWPLPPERTRATTLYLSKRQASSIFGDWFSVANDKNNYRLVTKPKEKDYYDRFLWWRWDKHAPELEHNPLKLHGLISRSSTRWLMGLPALVSQASKFLLNLNVDKLMPWEDERLDEVGVLTFTTGALSEDVEIAGPLKLTFWAKTDFTRPLAQYRLDRVLDTIRDNFNLDNNLIVDAMDKKDVQWVVELNDVFPGGRARNITSGWLSAENRPYDPANLQKIDDDYVPFDPFYDRSYKTPSPIQEDRVYKYVVELWPTDNVFKKGHRIRLSLSASDFPHLFPILRPSDNDLIIDDKGHTATLSFKTVTSNGDYKWVNAVNSYMMNHQD